MLRSIKGISRKVGSGGHPPFLTHEFSIKLSLLTTLVRRDLEARYKGSILGNLWPLLNQLVQLLIYIYVFSVVLQVKLDIQGMPTDSRLTFGLWLFAGLIPWFAFTNGLTQAAISIIVQPNLVKKVVFPLGLLPLVPILSAFIESTFGLILLILTVFLSSQALEYSLGLLPLVWISQLFLTAGLGYWMAGLTVFLRDIPQSLGVILNLWFYLTPIVYPLSKIPSSWQPWILWFNPMTAIVEAYRDLVLVGQLQHSGELAIASIVAMILFCSGLWVYRRLRPAFADVL